MKALFVLLLTGLFFGGLIYAILWFIRLPGKAVSSIARQAKAPLSPPVTDSAHVISDEAGNVDYSDVNFWEGARHSPFDALAYLRDGDYDGARMALQKIASIVHSEKAENPDLVRRFTALMCQFTRIDPLYRECMEIIVPLVEASPGILQTALYPKLPVDVETARYVLYFAHETGDLVREKKGNSYKVYPVSDSFPDAKYMIETTPEIMAGLVNLNVSIEVRHDENMEECGALNKQATQAKKDGDLDRAVALLFEVKEKNGDMYESTRLAKFLQQAGCFDEAMTEIQWLIDHSQMQVEALFDHQPKSVRSHIQAGRLFRIHKDAILIARRGKRPDLVAHHEAEYERWVAERDRLKKIAEADEQKWNEEWEAAKAAGGDAMAAFHEKWQRPVF
ncbi:hypothetical protein AGMMS50256_25720 [Betaproteobacteria bacterium]|nr:hypothetical protein AGMMS50256_25720 [Betaproteobacteria bacterium]